MQRLGRWLIFLAFCPCVLGTTDPCNLEAVSALSELVERWHQAPRVRASDQFVTRESVLEGLSALGDEAAELLRPNLLKKSAQAEEILSRRFGVKRTGAALVSAAVKRFGDFPQALDAAGLQLAPGRPRVINRPPAPVPEAETFARDAYPAEKLKAAEKTASHLLTYSKVESKEALYGDYELFRAMNYLKYLSQAQGASAGDEYQKRAERLEQALGILHQGLQNKFIRAKLHPEDPHFDRLRAAVEAGMKRAIRRFDPSLGVRFGYYASLSVGYAIWDERKKISKEGNVTPIRSPQILDASRVAETNRRYESRDAEADEREKRTLLLDIFERESDRAQPLRYLREAEILRRHWGVARELGGYAEPESDSQIAKLMGLSPSRLTALRQRALKDFEVMKRKLRAHWVEYRSFGPLADE